jgi:cyclase
MTACNPEHKKTLVREGKLDMTQLPTSQHFSLYELAEGVYAAIHAPGGWAQSNAGIIDTGDRTLIYDTFISPLATQDLLVAAQTLTGRSAHLVINSHYHNDHTWGNLAVPAGTDILSTGRTRAIIAKRETRLDPSYHPYILQELGKTQSRLEHATNERERAHARYFVVYYQAILNTLPLLPARVPNVVFQGELEFFGTKRRVRLIERGGHTASDAILYLPDDHIVFLSDLLFVQAHTYLEDGDPEELLQTMATIKELGADVLVGGHGSPGRVEDVDAMLDYVHEMQALVQQAIQAGVSREEISRQPVPAKYVHWLFSNFYQENVLFLYQRYSTP